MMNHISFSKDLPNAHSTLAYIIKVKSHVSNLLAPYIFMQFASPSLSYSYVYHHFKKRFKTSSSLSFVTTTDPKLEPTYIGMYHHDTNKQHKPEQNFIIIVALMCWWWSQLNINFCSAFDSTSVKLTSELLFLNYANVVNCILCIMHTLPIKSKTAIVSKVCKKLRLVKSASRDFHVNYKYIFK